MNEKQKKGSFSAWMIRNFSKEERKDLAEHGADTGWQYLTYYSDTVKLYEKFKDEIWETLSDDCESFDSGNVLQFIGSFNGAKNVEDEVTFKNLLVWYMAEKTARDLTEGY